MLPAFDPNTCTGCGQCWTRCPDSAIGSVVIQLALAGGDNAEAGSGEKATVRLALAVTEFQRQPLINRFIEDIATVREKILENIKLSLSSALPTDDLDVLAKGLETIHPSGKTPLSALTEQAEQGLIDAARLHRLVKTS
ncbi:MAG: 4Fe-4S binding protein [Pseudomonadota bacterium]